MDPFTEFHICMQHYYRVWVYIWLCSCGQLLYYFCRYYLYWFPSTFDDILITSTPYVLSGELYHSQIPIAPDYNLLTHLLLRETRALLPVRCPTMGHPHLHKFYLYYRSTLCFLEPCEFIPILNCNLDLPKCLA